MTPRSGAPRGARDAPGTSDGTGPRGLPAGPAGTGGADGEAVGIWRRHRALAGDLRDLLEELGASALAAPLDGSAWSARREPVTAVGSLRAAVDLRAGVGPRVEDLLARCSALAAERLVVARHALRAAGDAHGMLVQHARGTAAARSVPLCGADDGGRVADELEKVRHTTRTALHRLEGRALPRCPRGYPPPPDGAPPARHGRGDRRIFRDERDARAAVTALLADLAVPVADACRGSRDALARWVSAASTAAADDAGALREAEAGLVPLLGPPLRPPPPAPRQVQPPTAVHDLYPALLQAGRPALRRPADHPHPPGPVERIVLADRFPHDVALSPGTGLLLDRHRLLRSVRETWHLLVENHCRAMRAWVEDAVRRELGPYHRDRAEYLAGRLEQSTAAVDRAREGVRAASAGHAGAGALREAWKDLGTAVDRLTTAPDHGVSAALDLALARARPVLEAAGPAPGTAGRARHATRAHPDGAGPEPLRVAVVAPMNAGKSTLLNALARAELLPTRNTATTFLPTRVVIAGHDPAGSGPPTGPVAGLHVPERFRLALRRTCARLAGARVQDGAARRLVERDRHLADLLRRLGDGDLDAGDAGDAGPGPARDGVRAGAAEVRARLAGISDLLRLARLVHRDAGGRVEGTAVEDWPRVDVLLPRDAATRRTGGPARPVEFVDTPGLDESRLGDEITRHVLAALSVAHAVLVVLDLTRLGTRTDLRAARLLVPFGRIVPPEGWWVVVNKADQRRPGDRDPDQVACAVRQMFAEVGPIPRDHVLEVSAHRAQVAHSYRTEPAPVARDRLLQARYPEDWREHLAGADARTLDDTAERLLARSGVPAASAAVLDGLRREADRLLAVAGAVRAHDALAARRATDPARFGPLIDDLAWALTTDGVSLR